MAELARRLDTASMVARWREANPGLAGTEADCVSESIRGVAEAMGKGGVPLQDVRIRTGSAMVLLLFKRDEESGDAVCVPSVFFGHLLLHSFFRSLHSTRELCY